MKQYFWLLTALTPLVVQPALAYDTPHPHDEPSTAVKPAIPEKTTKDANAKDPNAKDPNDFYRAAKSYGTAPETDPPRYVRNLSKTGIEMFKDLTWLEGGAEVRERYEYRNGDLRRSDSRIDQPLLQRTRAYLAVKDILDPLRFTVEVQDSRRFFSNFVMDDRDYNQIDILQGYGELYFKDAIGKDAPVRIRAGRMAFEVLDRRLIARNEWRNTTNAFQGVRALIGQQKNMWDLDMFALQPMRRALREIDDPQERQWVYGMIGAWRKWSDIVTFQPFYLGLHVNEKTAAQTRMIHSPGLRAYGVIPDTAFDFDGSVVYQFGTDAGRDMTALGTVTEIGYTLKDDWKTRFSAQYGYASGDQVPTDRKHERFERFFGFARPWSNNDYFQWENLHAPKLRVEVTPSTKLRADAGVNAYWLASNKDRWNVANLRDTAGQRGSYIGSEIDGRFLYKLHPHVNVTSGYAFFKPGEFTKNSGRPKDTHFFYLELTFKLFE